MKQVLSKHLHQNFFLVGLGLEIRAIKQLMDEYGLTQETVAERIGKSRSNIANTLRLLSLYPDVIKLVETGIIYLSSDVLLTTIG